MAADSLKCVFVHIPKCGGVSITKSLFGNLGGSHLRIDQYQRIYTSQELSEYFTFTFVRNPWDRLASAFFFLKEGGMNACDQTFSRRVLAGYPDFESFVMGWLKSDTIMAYIHFWPQWYFLCGRDESPTLDFIGRFENFPDDLAYVCERLGVQAALQFHNRTREKPGDYRALYSERMIQHVADVYAKDIQLFGYAFDT